MSDHVVQLMIKDPYMTVSQAKRTQILFDLQNIVNADRIEVHQSDNPVFVDCGGDLSEIICPHCGSEIPITWWSDEMTRLYEHRFKELISVVPCCKTKQSLSDLSYHAPCGFACCYFSIWNPSCELDDEDKATIGKIFGCSIQIVNCRY